MIALERARYFGLLAFLGTVLMLFTAFTASMLVRRHSADWSPVSVPPILGLTTAVLLFSSLTVEAGRRTLDRRWFAATLALGLVFVAGQVWGWTRVVAGGPATAFFYVMTGAHAAHVGGGLVALAVAARRVDRARADLVGTYWHFVDLIWIALLILLSAM